jgi:nucleoside-specific outer membrane channel protein Tsx
MAKSRTFTATLGAALMSGALLAASLPAAAAEWSDTSISYRYGTKFHEPFNTQDITKSIVNFTHASGYKYGTNFFSIDYLMSDSKDPGGGIPGNPGAQEFYAVYRNTVDLGKVTGKDMKMGFIRGWGVTFGFDANTKNDGYASKKRMLVLGPTMMLDVPGFLNISLLLLDESNAPNAIGTRYHYKDHAMLTGAWSIPIGSMPLAFEGFMNIIAPKGTDEFGAQTKTETNFDGQLMLDVGSVMGGPKGTFKVGLEYQYWKNKFGNDSAGPAGQGAFAKTPMIRAEYHF